MKANVDTDLIRGKTKSGFEFEISKEKLDDIELLDAIETFDETSNGMTRVLNRLLGTEQKKKLYDHVRNEEGTAPISKIVPLITEIFEICGAGNSSSSPD